MSEHGGSNERVILMWESEIRRLPDGRAEVVAKQPVATLTCAQAAKTLACTAWTVRKLFRAGLLTGYKPGAKAVRKDGQRSNAVICLDAASVAAYKQSQIEAARK